MKISFCWPKAMLLSSMVALFAYGKSDFTPPSLPLEAGPDFPLIPFCGDTIVTIGEECEDGNVINGDGCSSECKKEFCGNGLIESGEQCDNGVGRNKVQGPRCDQYCQFIICGNGIVGIGEQCDTGNWRNMGQGTLCEYCQINIYGNGGQ